MIKLAVGEYAGGYGFPLPRPSHLFRERLRLWLETEWNKMTQKTEELGVRRWSIEMSNTIQLREAVLCGLNGQCHRWRLSQFRDSDGNPNVRCLNWNGDEWNWYWLENVWHENNPAALRATASCSLPTSRWESFVLYKFVVSNLSFFAGLMLY